MPAVTVRDVPEATRAELAARAAASGRSLQEYLRAVLVDLAARPEPAAVLRRAGERSARLGTRLDAEQILGFLDDGRS